MLGITAPDFPNLFFVYGPNSNLGHNSIIFMIECQVNYIIKLLDMKKSNPSWKYLQVKRDAVENFYETHIQKALVGKVSLRYLVLLADDLMTVLCRFDSGMGHMHFLVPMAGERPHHRRGYADRKCLFFVAFIGELSFHLVFLKFCLHFVCYADFVVLLVDIMAD